MSKPERNGFDTIELDIEEGLSAFRPDTSPLKSKKSKSSQKKVKEGLYFSKDVSKRLDQEWKKQPRGGLSKSVIVENIIRETWGWPLLEE